MARNKRKHGSVAVLNATRAHALGAAEALKRAA
jgi:hypothetical protein